jgi:hypothetical protein
MPPTKPHGSPGRPSAPKAASAAAGNRPPEVNIKGDRAATTGLTRATEMNKRVLANLDTMITEVEKHAPGRARRAAGKGTVRTMQSWYQHTVLLLCYRSGMAVRKKRSISMPPDLDAEIAAAAAHAGMTYSSWLAATVRKEFTIRAGLAAVSQFEQEHGAFTPEELAEASQWAAEAAGRATQTGASHQRRSA